MIQCFFSKPDNAENADRIVEAEKIANAVGKSLGIEVISLPPTAGGSFKSIRQTIAERIDPCAMMLVETGGFSWYVASELFYGLDRLPLITMIIEQRTPSGPPSDRSIIKELSNLRTIDSPHPISETQRNDFEEMLKESFVDALRRLDAWARHVTKTFRTLKAAAKLPDELQLVDPRYKETDNDDAPDITLKPAGLEALTEDGPVTLLAPSGCGKTLFLERIAEEFCEDSYEEICHADKLHRAVLYMDSSYLKHRPVEEEFWEIVERRLETIKIVPPKGDTMNPVKGYANAGLVYVLVDGLDEFAVLRRNDRKALLQKLAEGKSKGYRVIVTCRKSFWNHLIRPLTISKQFREISFLRFNTEEAKRILGADNWKHLPEDYQNDTRLITNPLILKFLRELCNKFSDGIRNILPEKPSRSGVYHVWLDDWCREEATQWRTEPVKVRRFYQKLSRARLLARKPGIDGDQFFRIAKEELGPVALLPDDQMTRRGVIIPPLDNKNEALFVHESLYEYFAISGLEEELKMIVANRENHEWVDFDFNKVELDYLETSSYGYFQEALDEDFIKHAISFFCEYHLSPTIEKLHRNLIEFIGMTFFNQQDLSRLAHRLMDIVENKPLLLRKGTALVEQIVPKSGSTWDTISADGLIEEHTPSYSDKVRFNAARTLERIHPCAPTPYESYLSDWRKFPISDNNMTREIDGRKLIPKVMKGYGAEAPKPGKQYRFAFRNDIAYPMALQIEISKRIERFLASAIAHPENVSESIRINVSNAWIRWIAPDDLPKATALVNQARGITDKNRKIEKETLENLEIWVPKVIKNMTGA
jgi:hypothetical protein